MLTSFAWIALGGALGALARYGVSTWCLAWFGSGFPIGTLIVNVTGSFVLGVIGALLATEAGLPAPVRPLIAVGFVGAYTTFSTYAFDTVKLGGRSLAASMLYVLLNNALSLLAVVVGMAAARVVGR